MFFSLTLLLELLLFLPSLHQNNRISVTASCAVAAVYMINTLQICIATLPITDTIAAISSRLSWVSLSYFGKISP
jgi:hypothetical protein